MTVRIVGWALIHSLWQGAVIAILLGIGLTALRKAPAAWRHWLCFAAMLAMAVAPLLTSMRYQAAGSATSLTAASTFDLTTRDDAAPTERAAGLASPRSSARLDDGPQVSGNLGFDAERWLPWLVVAWLIGVLLLSVRMIGGYVWARRLVILGTGAVSADIQDAASRIASRLCPHALIRVLASTRAQVPMVIGMLRPVVLIPASLLTGLTPAQVEAILAHELAHVRRYDYAINLLQTVFETLLFFHPAMWWLSRRMRDEREQACDELAVSICGDPYFYSRVLLAVEEWRSVRIAFAPAATGGSLSRRIRKLIGEDDRRLDVGPRWFAGVVTVAAVLLAGSSAARDELNAQPSTEAVTTQDTARARPASIHKYNGSGALAARLEWARSLARQQKFERYWFGYVVAGDVPGSQWDYIDRNSPVLAGDSWFSGRMRFDGDFRGIKFSGVALNTLLGDYAPRQHAVLLAFDEASRRPRLVRVRLANFVFPAHFNSWPLFWAHEAPIDQSVQLLASLQDQISDDDVLGDLPAVIGAHSDTRAVVPVLVRWSNQAGAARDLRFGAIEALAYQDAPAALATLARLARTGGDEPVRLEAVEAMEHMPMRAAADTLIALAGSLETARLRAEAIESLGHRNEPHVAPFLENVARTGDQTLRGEAIAALASLPDGRGISVVGTIARDAAMPGDVRKEAVEALGSHDELNGLETLRQITFDEGDVGVQIEATEALGNMDDPRAIEVLRRIADTHPQTSVQIEAAEALGNAHPHGAAMTALENIARRHPQSSVRARAIESLGNFSEDHGGAAILMRIIETEKNEALIKEAVETLGDAGRGGEVVGFLEKFLKSNAGAGAKIEALEALSELPDDAGVRVLRLYARSADSMLRDKALELLEER
jgi:beta-lactamase regulating signal transducer with metallopeptidase domain/HEAT repeat protein